MDPSVPVHVAGTSLQVARRDDRRRSGSLGAKAYRRLLEAAGLLMTGETDDEGENHYHMAFRP